MIAYEVVDMFTDRPFGGSALGVVPAAEGLTTGQMERIARELNTDETVFVLPPTSPEATHRVRVFTPSAESPYGGHSAVGTAATLVRLGLLRPGPVVQQCGDRLLRLWSDGESATMTAADPLPGEELDPGPLLDAVGLEPADVDGGAARTAGFGPLFHFLPVQAGAVERARSDPAAMRGAGLSDVFVFCWDGRGRTARARLFAPGYGIPEDPACASAALGLAAWLAAEGLAGADGRELRFGIDQGRERGRPATLACRARRDAGGTLTAALTGRVVPTLRGEIALAAPAETAGRPEPTPGGVHALSP
ncbi:trans-2,3-dihydro-3-hydroxyanthranilate isomerase [Thermomonospora echinospora]|uniref:Trans-2,3-dihydro-3-hydroxyanthranilate isomerase n=1 Tax=Thermomonospora echinospora TaxID=1992 RepID=A0A1H6DG47_9ACTN|nr:PhzF family phenazine biosynthesis isomerase [Thermomonospora echinospora]SEG83576.1 trans-2,3-dihydro-3-hydroxyanthranilate isomerase [Thermomonospora echinospora]